MRVMKFSKITNKNTSKLTSYFSRNFATYNSKVVVIGGGTAGLAVSSQLVEQNVVNSNEIAVFDPTAIHYYQPGYTKLGGGILKDLKEIEYNVKDLAKNYNFQNVGVKSINPETNSITTENNDVWNYEQLVIAAGLNVKLDSIPGLKELMDDKTKFVSTIYDPQYALKVKWMRENFKGGRALFTQPPAPIKCGGAPQKIAYLCDDYWKKHNIKADVHFFTPLPQMFAVKYYSDTLAEIVKEKGIHPHFTSVLQSVRDGVATFKNTTDNTIFEEKFDFLHAVPLMSSPDFLKNSPVAGANGFVTVDQSMRHKKYKNVWAIGDCTDLPNAKTAAAVFSQAPVLVHNLETEIKKTAHPLALYDGYSSCPIYLSKGSLLLCEFKDYYDEKGNLVKELDESFHPGKQNVPRKLYYWIACAFTKIYPYSLKGRWFGKTSVIRPDFTGKNNVNIRKLYKYVDYVPYVGGGLLLAFLLY